MQNNHSPKTFALDLVDRGQATTFGVIHDARTELRAAVDHSIELADKLAATAFRFARKVVQRVDDAVAASLGSAEKLATASIAKARETAHVAKLDKPVAQA